MSQKPRHKVTKFVQSVKSVDGISDAVKDSTSQPRAGHSRKSSSSDPSPRFTMSTKASRARSNSQWSRPGTMSRKNTNSDELSPTTVQTSQTHTDSKEAKTMTVQVISIPDKLVPSEASEMYIVLQYNEQFPHCKAHGVFVDIIDANNKVIEFFKEDEEGRDTESRGKVNPYISELGCLQYSRNEISPEAMVWVTKVPAHPKGADDVLQPWPNEEDMETIWEASGDSGPERRKAAGW